MQPLDGFLNIRQRVVILDSMVVYLLVIHDNALFLAWCPVFQLLFSKIHWGDVLRLLQSDTLQFLFILKPFLQANSIFFGQGINLAVYAFRCSRLELYVHVFASLWWKAVRLFF